MLVIDTKMTPPTGEMLAKEAQVGNEVWHVPALQYRPTGISIDLSGFDAAFLGSPRAVNLAKDVLKNFTGVVFTAGNRTAQVLLQNGIPVAAAGSENGAGKDFPHFLKIRKVQKVAWISAAQTAADLEQVAKENSIEIQHFAVYETSAAPVDEEKFRTLEHPVAWNFYSGKAVLALKRFIRKEDLVHLYGATAEAAFKNVEPSLQSAFV